MNTKKPLKKKRKVPSKKKIVSMPGFGTFKKKYPSGGTIRNYIETPQHALDEFNRKKKLSQQRVASNMGNWEQLLGLAGSMISGVNKLGVGQQSVPIEGSDINIDDESYFEQMQDPNNTLQFTAGMGMKVGGCKTGYCSGGKKKGAYGMNVGDTPIDLNQLMTQADQERARIEQVRQDTLNRMQAGNPVIPMPQSMWKYSGGPYKNTCIGNACYDYAKAEGRNPIYGNQLFQAKYKNLGFRKLEEGEPVIPGDLGQIYEDNIPEHAMIYTGTGKQTYAGGSSSRGGASKTIKSADWNKIVSNPNINKGIWNYRYVGDEDLLNRADEAVEESLRNIKSKKTSISNILSDSPSLFPFGGSTGDDVEIEGGEIVELPNGVSKEFQGANHNQGGIDLENLPDGTKIYSDRLVGPDGKTMVQRKKVRDKEMKKLENKMSKLDKYLENSVKNKITNDTYDRMMEGVTNKMNELQQQDNLDMEFQESVSAVMGTGNYEGNPQAQYGMQVGDPLNPNVGQRLISAPSKSTDIQLRYDEYVKNEIEKQKNDPRISERIAELNQIQKSLGQQVTPFDYTEGLMDFETFKSVGNIEDLQETIDWRLSNQPIIEQNRRLTYPNGGYVFSSNKYNKNYKYNPEDNSWFYNQEGITDWDSDKWLKHTKDSDYLKNTFFDEDDQYTDKVSEIFQEPSIYEPLGVDIGKAKFDPIENVLGQEEFTDLPREKDSITDFGSDKNNFGDLTAGDYLGMAGTAVGGIGPMITTLANKRATQKNINTFKGFGKKALETNEDIQDYVARMKDNALQRLEQQSYTQRQRNRNAAKGINTMRAMDLATYMASNEAAKGISDVFSQQMMNILSQKQQFENIQDQIVMQGEDVRLQRDKADIDNFYSNMSSNLTNFAASLNQLGGDLNVSKTNKELIDILPQLSQYGLTVKEVDGKLTIVKD